VTKLERQGAAWKVETTRGTIVAKDVVVGTNGYTGEATPELQRRVIPLASYIIATEELPDDLARSLMPNNKSIYDTRRVLTYYRMSGDRKRLIFGGRAKFGPFDAVQTAPILYRIMTEIFPQLKGSKITHAWTGNVAFTFDETPHMGTLDGLHYALGCNGSGVAMMTYLGTQTARKIAGVSNYRTAFETDDFPTHWAYNGNPWFIPWVGRYFRARDWIDRRFN
jgi:glycine/D-amino acid oxidase-like deaminating enzyme